MCSCQDAGAYLATPKTQCLALKTIAMAIKYPIPKWDRPQPTESKLDYAELTNIDLSKFNSEAGKLELVETIR